MGLSERLRRYFKTVFGRWLSSRIPACNTVSLSQKNIFIFPSRFGLTFLVLALCLYILGANYENNLIQLISFLMVSMVFTAIFFSFRNFSALTVEGLAPAVAQVGGEVVFPVRLKVLQKLLALQLGFVGGDLIDVYQVEPTGVVVNVPLVAKRRGWLSPGRLLLQSGYPMGLVRCWTYLDCLNPALIYPAPLKCTFRLTDGSQGKENANGQKGERQGGDEFSHLREYHLGESLRQVSWKHVAQGRGMLSKSFVSHERQALWLGFDSVTPASLETRLSELAFAVRTLSTQGHLFGLVLGGQAVVPGHGQEHEHNCLRALALYGKVTSGLSGDR